ncbi:MAG: DEAD/DEAH box helicase family protein [Acidobacteria bacterium]|nr:DEAD/DEAH box helicase family protein [Acidobacteriota bacterium]
MPWNGRFGTLADFIRTETSRTLESYSSQPNLVAEHAAAESAIAHGGYEDRQVIELMQNASDSLLEAPNTSGRVEIRLTDNYLYCADDGKSIGEEGIRALMFARLSPKLGTSAIGRFGLGFKSVLRVTDAPEFHSRSVSFRFDAEAAKARIQDAAKGTDGPYPILRLPDPIGPPTASVDETLDELMAWATNIVRLPLLVEQTERLARQIHNFPPEFLLFVDHVKELRLDDGLTSRRADLSSHGNERLLTVANSRNREPRTSRWLVFRTIHTLSPKARDDPSTPDAPEGAALTWAAPLDRRTEFHHFWASFPTQTPSLLAGILNAPWKTNEDRQNLLPGNFNDELIRAAARLVADHLHELSTEEDPSAHLDVLPRRHEAGDSEHAELLRRELFDLLSERPIVPDQNGDLHGLRDLRYPPSLLTRGNSIDLAPFEQWQSYEGRPKDWLHHSGLNRVRLSTIDRLFPSPRVAPRASLSEWLEALSTQGTGDHGVHASMAAIRAAAAIREELRRRADLGRIILAANEQLRPIEPDSVFLPAAPSLPIARGEEGSTVHPRVAADASTLKALKQLGLRPPSAESRFRKAAKRAGLGPPSRPWQPQRREPSDDDLREFWAAARSLSPEAVQRIVTDVTEAHGAGPYRIRARTRAGDWQPLASVLLPGRIVPGDGSRDDEATVDLGFHQQDWTLLKKLGAVQEPDGGWNQEFVEGFDEFRDDAGHQYRKRDDLPSMPDHGYLVFDSAHGSGPLPVLRRLSEEGRDLYTRALLGRDDTLAPWTMRHETRDIYPPMGFLPLAVEVLWDHGRIQTSAGIVPLAEAHGQPPTNAEALDVLYRHENWEEIRYAFDLTDPKPAFLGEAESVPLTDVWPGLAQHLTRPDSLLIRCERILVAGRDVDCRATHSNVYLAESVAAEKKQLRLISRELDLDLAETTLQQILDRRTPREIQDRRDAIRQESSDTDRLLAAVGEKALRDQLPRMLVAVLEADGQELGGKRLAEAAIATWHTDALWQHREELDHLDPPKQWAGSPRAVEFVQSLGLPDEWAGKRARKRDPWLEVQGPTKLPHLHDYQEGVAGNLRALLRGDLAAGGERRAMISLPTGAGKTRVAVQAIVEAIRDGDFPGGALWVADRDELCEQAVEAWRQVWSSIGDGGEPLRISRAWSGQESPRPLTKRHVVVASIQTLQARRGHQDYSFLADLQLVVFDEAHRSIAPTYTSVMEEIGLTRYQRPDEPFLVGLTATPYRGRDEEETARLVNRYGKTRLDDGAFPDDEPTAVVQHLQRRGILSQVDHEAIQGGTFPLHDEDMRQEGRDSWDLPWLPKPLEDRIAGSTGRTKRILKAFEKHIEPRWPVLVFATSVEHAQTLAALLEDRGITSRAISGETRPPARQHAVEEFRSGRIQALVNYGVFREGFDAPKTRAILVARPVYSPNLYFQMIGRGLRGPRNGGTERCLILNVEDNIENFGPQLAFSDLDWLWNPP